MIITKGVNIVRFFQVTWKYIIILILFNTCVAALYYFNIIQLYIAWLPVSVIGTAVAFYVGFKNNNAYDRLWEARKIWGGIVNDSRSWGMMIDSYVNDLFTKEKGHEDVIKKAKKRLIYRHIAWLYMHRSQLLIPTTWEHVGQKGNKKNKATKYQNKYGIGILDANLTQDNLKFFLPDDEYDRLLNYSNTATQIINEQSRDLQELRKKDFIDDFRHMELEQLLKSFYTLQGKNERIKKFPLPRQYAVMSSYFVGIFIFLLPFSMMPELMKIDNWGIWLSVPITVLIGWVYIMMEITGDFSENPFQGMPNDIPMLSLCRTIEIDLREMLNEKDLPPSIKDTNGVLL